MTTPVVIGKGHDFNQIKAEAKLAIDRRAEGARREIITPIFGQDYVYQQKIKEAEEFLAGAIDSTAYPFLWAEADATQTSMAQVANSILSAKRSADAKLARIESIRRQAKQAIDACENKIASINSIVGSTVF